VSAPARFFCLTKTSAELVLAYEQFVCQKRLWALEHKSRRTSFAHSIVTTPPFSTLEELQRSQRYYFINCFGQKALLTILVSVTTFIQSCHFVGPEAPLLYEGLSVLLAYTT